MEIKNCLLIIWVYNWIFWYLNDMILEYSADFEIKLLLLSWMHLLVTHSASQLLTNNWHLSDIFNTLSSIMFIREYSCFAATDSKNRKKKNFWVS